MDGWVIPVNGLLYEEIPFIGQPSIYSEEFGFQKYFAESKNGQGGACPFLPNE
jgi:hypothetical protein